MNKIQKEEIVWHKIKKRPMTEEERTEYSELMGIDVEYLEDYIFDCLLPEDDEEILIQNKYGILIDKFIRDEYGMCGLEDYGDLDDIIAWASMPKGWKKD